MHYVFFYNFFIYNNAFFHKILLTLHALLAFHTRNKRIRDYYNLQMLAFYNNSLEAGWIVFGLLAFLLLGNKSLNKEFSNYVFSRRCCGGSFAAFAIGVFFQWYFNPRLEYPMIATAVALSYFHIGATLFAMSHTSVLDPNIKCKKRVIIDMISSLLSISTVWAGALLEVSSVMIISFFIFFAHIIYMSYMLISTYTRVVRNIANISSDETELAVKWLPISSFMMVIFGMSCSFASFVNAQDNHLMAGSVMILIAIPIFLYIYISYMNFSMQLLHISPVLESALEDANNEENLDLEEIEQSQTYLDVCKRIDAWIEEKGFLKEGITSQELANIVASNRMYVSKYFNSKGKTFRDTINDLRIDESFDMLKKKMTIEEIATKVGLSRTHYIRIFTNKMGVSPSEWRAGV